MGGAGRRDRLGEADRRLTRRRMRRRIVGDALEGAVLRLVIAGAGGGGGNAFALLLVLGHPSGYVRSRELVAKR